MRREEENVFLAVGDIVEKHRVSRIVVRRVTKLRFITILLCLFIRMINDVG